MEKGEQYFIKVTGHTLSYGNRLPTLEWARYNNDFYGDGKPAFASALTTKTTKTQPYPSTKLVLAHRVGATGEVAVLDKAVPWLGARNQGYTRVLRKGRFMPPDRSSFSVAIRHGRFFTLGSAI